MESNQEKVSKYLYTPINSQSLHLKSEVKMLEERLKNLEYLKQTYEKSAKEKSAELDTLTRDNFELKTQLIEKNRKIDDLIRQHSMNESNLMGIIEELKTNKQLLEQEVNFKSSHIYDLEQNLQEQFAKNLKFVDENQALRREIKEKAEVYNSQVELLEEKLKQLLLSQRITEQRVNKALNLTTPKKKTVKSTGKISDMYKKEVALNKSLKGLINEMHKKQPEDIENRLLNSEKKIRELESALVSTSKNDSGTRSLRNSLKLRSLSQSIRNKKSRYA